MQNLEYKRLLHPAVVQRKMTNGYRSKWAATGEADIRTVADTVRLSGATAFATILKTVDACARRHRPE